MENIKIVYDQRERASHIISEIYNLNTNKLKIDLEIEQLSVGDYLITNDLIIERKTISDLESSIIDGRIFSQLQELKNIQKSGIIIEGNINYLLEGKGRLKKNVFLGLFSSIGFDYRIPIFFTKNQKETASLLVAISKREQIKNKNKLGKLRYEKSKLTASERQLFIIESFPEIGPNLAKSIISEFKTIKNFVNSEVKDLEKIDKLGKKKAKTLKYLIQRKFN